MGKQCAVCGMNCGIGSLRTNNGEHICSICVEKCGGKKNPKIKEMSVPELKDIVREFNRKALESRNANTQNEPIVQQVVHVYTRPPMSKQGKGCLLFLIIIASISALFWILIILSLFI